mgnify:FL=1
MHDLWRIELEKLAANNADRTGRDVSRTLGAERMRQPWSEFLGLYVSPERWPVTSGGAQVELETQPFMGTKRDEKPSDRIARVIQKASVNPLKTGIDSVFEKRLGQLDPFSDAARELRCLYVDMMSWLADST